MTRNRFIVALGAVALSLSVAEAAAQAPSSAVACVALTTPSVQGISGDSAAFASGVRDLFANYLKGPTLRTETLEARLTSQAVIEARGKQCGQVLLVSVTRKRSGNSTSRILGQAAGAAVMRAPIAGAIGSAASTATWTGGEAIYRFASDVRASDELELSYRLGVPDAVERAKPVTSKTKAKADGEDLLTPLVEKASGSIAATVTASERK